MSKPGPPVLSTRNIRPLATPNTLEFWWSPPSIPSLTVTAYYLSNVEGYIAPINLGLTNYYKLTGLSNAVDYTFTITGSNNFGLGVPNRYRTVQSGSKPSRCPVAVVNRNDSIATVRWLSATPVDADIKWYIIQPTSSNPNDSIYSLPAKGKLSAHASDTRRTFTGLNPANTYSFAINAISDPGYSIPTVADSFLATGLLLQLDASNFNPLSNIWYDSINNNNFLTAAGSLTTTSNSLVFNGSSYLSNAPFNQLLSQFTFSTWFNPLSNVNAAAVFSSIDDGNSPYVANFAFEYNSGSNAWLGSSYLDNDEMHGNILTLTPSNWYNAVVSYDGSNVFTYVNGVFVGSNTPGLTLQTKGLGWYIGSSYTGQIGQILLYSNVMTPEQVRQNYNVNVINYVDPETVLSYYSA